MSAPADTRTPMTAEEWAITVTLGLDICPACAADVCAECYGPSCDCGCQVPEVAAEYYPDRAPAPLAVALVAAAAARVQP